MHPAVAIGGLASAIYAWWYLAAPGRSVTTGLADVSSLLTGSITLSDQQRAMVDIIHHEFAAAGLSWLSVAAVTNAYAESRLDPLAAGDSGKSIGLFQLHENGGGKGLSRVQREDPTTNTRRILQEAKAAGMASKRGLTHAELASEFARLVERCWECDGGGGTAQLTYRAELVAKLFGEAVAAEVP